MLPISNWSMPCRLSLTASSGMSGGGPQVNTTGRALPLGTTAVGTIAGGTTGGTIPGGGGTICGWAARGGAPCGT